MGVSIGVANSDPKGSRPPVTVPHQANDHARNFNPGPGVAVTDTQGANVQVHVDTPEDIDRSKRP